MIVTATDAKDGKDENGGDAGKDGADRVDQIVRQWQKERPDLDLGPMATIGRLKRCAALVQRRLDEGFAQAGLNSWEFDVLATLRRSGAPYQLAPTELFSALMVTSGTMTHRLHQLEGKGLIRRVANPHDARSLLVELTDAGLAVIDRAVTAHLQNEHALLDGLGKAERSTLDVRLKRLLALLEAGLDAGVAKKSGGGKAS